MKKKLFSDVLFKIIYKLKDYSLKAKWIFVLGHIGNGSFLRSGVKIIGNPKRIRIGKNFKIYENSILAIGKGSIQIGDNGLIGVGTYINCGNEQLVIGNNVAIAPYCKIFTYSHHFSDEKPTNECYKNGDVIIEDNVLVGSNSVILPGVRIGHNAVIGACSLVIKDVEPNTIVAGSPAKVIKPYL
jgi:acetyltransferase-like isoleucine patch superfamily enzyme